MSGSMRTGQIPTNRAVRSARTRVELGPRVRRLLIGVGILSMLGGPLAPSGVAARSSGVRTESKEYTGAFAAQLGYEPTPNAYAGDCDPTSDAACVRFELKPKDRFFKLEITDQTGQAVYAVAFAPDGSEVIDFCGAMETPAAAPGAFLDVWITAGTCFAAPTPSAPTIGVVEAQFARTKREL
jgi:hypothetical protein